MLQFLEIEGEPITIVNCLIDHKLALDDYNKAISLFSWNATWYSERSSVLDNLERYDEKLSEISIKRFKLMGMNGSFIPRGLEFMRCSARMKRPSKTMFKEQRLRNLRVYVQ